MTENDLRARVCAQALAWKGRRESDGSHREIINVYNTIRPLPRGYKLQYTDAWCAGFVSAVAQVCKLTDMLFPECGCGPMIELYKAAGRWVEDDGYLPAPGDVIFYDWQDSGVGDNRGSADHVGLVVDVQGDRITVCEGNMSNAVGLRTLSRDGRYIRGYGVPDYAAAASAINAHEDPEDEPPTVVVVPASPSGGGVEQSEAEGAVSDPDTITLPALPAGCAYVALPTLQIGDKSEAVRAAQLLLYGRGFSVGWFGCDGEFGRKTESAVGKFQRDREIECDGVIGPETWGKLICD